MHALYTVCMRSLFTKRNIGFGILIIQLIFVYFVVSKNSPFVSFAVPINENRDTPYLHVKEVVHVTETVDSKPVDVALPVKKVLFEYVEVTNGCGPHFEGDCLLVRSGPGTDFPVVSRLRNGMVLKVGGRVERASTTWYKIVFDDEWLRYPERLSGDWYISSDYVDVLFDEGTKTLEEEMQDKIPKSEKRIVVDRSEQMLTAYYGASVFIKVPISTGLALTPTPRGTFKIFKKMPSRYMQGPLPYINDNQYYDLPGVPWNMYFTSGGAAIHGAYWHKKFGSPYSHGCVNLPPETAKTLYAWADLGTTVIVQD